MRDPSYQESPSDTATSHIASLVIQADATRLSDLFDRLVTIDGVEVHASDPCGKLVVTIESDCASGIADVLNRIRELRWVFSANLVYHQVEDRAVLEQEISL